MCEHPCPRQLASQVLHSLGLASRELWRKQVRLGLVGSGATHSVAPAF